MSPELIVSTGFNDASKQPRCTVSGDAVNSCTFGAVWARAAVNIRQQATIISPFFIIASEGFTCRNFSNSLTAVCWFTSTDRFCGGNFCRGLQLNAVRLVRYFAQIFYRVGRLSGGVVANFQLF